MSTSETNRTSTPRTRATKPDSASRPKAPAKAAASRPEVAVADKTVKAAGKPVKGAMAGNEAKPPKAAAVKEPKRESESAASSAVSTQSEPAARGDGVDAHEWHRLVSEAAYFRAERRGFINGSPEQDWLEAEEEVRRIRQRAGE